MLAFPTSEIYLPNQYKPTALLMILFTFTNSNHKILLVSTTDLSKQYTYIRKTDEALEIPDSTDLIVQGYSPNNRARGSLQIYGKDPYKQDTEVTQ